MIYLISLSAFFLRLINLNQSLWLDEAIQAWASSSFTLETLITKFMPSDVHPPLSYLISLLSGKLIGYSEISLRLPSVIFGCLTVYVIFKLALKLKLKQPILPAALLATSGLHIYYSQEARMYSLMTLLATLSLYFLISSLKKNRYFIYYSVFTALAVSTHYYTWFMLPVHWLIVFSSNPKKIKPFILSQLAIIFGFLPLLPNFTNQLAAGLQAATNSPEWGSTVGGLSLKSLSLIPVKFIIGRISFDNNYVYLAFLIIPLLISLYLFINLIKNYQKNRSTSVFILSWLFVPLIIGTIISFKIPVLGYHRFLFVLPALYLAQSQGLSFLKSSTRKPLIITLLLFNLITSGIYLLNSRFHREDWRGLASQLVANNQSGSPVAILAPVRTPLIYYYGGEIINYQDITPDFDSGEVWLASYAEPIFDPNLATKSTLKTIGFKPVFEKHFRGDLTLIQYTHENRH